MTSQRISILKRSRNIENLTIKNQKIRMISKSVDSLTTLEVDDMIEDTPISILKRGGARTRSEYSDHVLAQHYVNYLDIIENIRTRPRLPSPPLMLKDGNQPRARRQKKKKLRWSDANMSRSKSHDHLANMRSSCKCVCDNRILSKSVANLSEINEKVKNTQHQYVNCDESLHSEAFNKLVEILKLQSDDSSEDILDVEIKSLKGNIKLCPG